MYIEQLERAAKLNYINGRIEQAADEYKELYEHYAKEDGESANVTMQNLTWLGDCLLARSKFAEAATAYETVLDKTAERTAFKNSMPDLKIKLGDIYFHLQNYTKARYYYMDAYRDKSKDHPDLESKLLAELSARTADCERILAMYREAISHYQQAINDWEEVKEPVLGNIVMCNYYIGFCYMKLGNYADALKKYQEVFRDGGEKNIQMKSQASYVIAVRQYRDLLWKEGDYIQWFQQALRAADLQKELAAK
jgi:tetratricopeptide (TPR) repeat protein